MGILKFMNLKSSLMSNLLKDKYPELLKEWDYEKNEKQPEEY